jgi:hypothetical protein
VGKIAKDTWIFIRNTQHFNGMVLVTPHSDHPDPLVKKLPCGVRVTIIDVQRECTHAGEEERNAKAVVS